MYLVPSYQFSCSDQTSLIIGLLVLLMHHSTGEISCYI